MLLTRLTYKITLFLDFQPFLQSFQSVDTYIKNLMTDITNLAYFKRLLTPYHNIPPIIGHNNSNILRFLRSPGCSDCPYACCSKLKFDHFNLEIHKFTKYSMQYTGNS